MKSLWYLIARFATVFMIELKSDTVSFLSLRHCPLPSRDSGYLLRKTVLFNVVLRGGETESSEEDEFWSSGLALTPDTEDEIDEQLNRVEEKERIVEAEEIFSDLPGFNI